ncbi:MAG TPA: glycosyl transferase, partial [Stellaceae bacterium]|nr:glycosyl transferase [Stellaceae bacterium]
QQAVRRGLGHAAVAWRVAAANAVLIGCGWAAEQGWGVIALAAAAVVTGLLLADLAGLPRRGPAAEEPDGAA